MSNVSSNSLPVGTVLNDKWVILEFIDKGGMGELYRAHQLNLKRDVAIKVISREWLESLGGDAEELLNGLQRFRNEVQAMAQIRHTNILQIFDHGSFSIGSDEKDIPMEYIAMEYVPGGTLRSTMSEEGFYPEEGLIREWLMRYFLPVLDGVEALHNAKIVHRDLKPGNVLMDGEIPKIADFGLARSEMLKPVTQSSDIKGTPAYMPIEQFVDFRRTDERTDIYALGKVLYEAVDGKMKPDSIPFRKAALKNPKTPFLRELDAVIQKATAEDKNERHGSVGELRDELLHGIFTSAEKEPKQHAPDVIPRKPRLGVVLSRRKWILSGAALAGVFVLFMVFRLWNIADRTVFQPPRFIAPETTSRSPVRPGIAGSKGLGNHPSIPMPNSLSGEDGVTLHLIPGGTIRLPAGFISGAAESVSVAPFYMDETQVTNHQYVDFLNKVLSRIRVEQGVVKSKGNIWLFLGESLQGYEPIVYRDGRFHITKAEHAACPVIRVTAYGASAYARFYGRRLADANEWAYAVLKGQKEDPSAGAVSETTQQNANGEDMDQMMKTMHPESGASPSSSARIPAPVILSKPDAFGVRGLNGEISEWGTEALKRSSSGKGEREYVILGGLPVSSGKGGVLPAPLARNPWEGFGQVGFRCVLSPAPPG